MRGRCIKGLLLRLLCGEFIERYQKKLWGKSLRCLDLQCRLDEVTHELSSHKQNAHECYEAMVSALCSEKEKITRCNDLYHQLNRAKRELEETQEKLVRLERTISEERSSFNTEIRRLREEKDVLEQALERTMKQVELHKFSCQQGHAL